MNKKTFSLALFTVVIWASAFPAIRASLQGGYTSAHLILVRFLIASSLFLLYSLLPNVHFHLPNKKDIPRILMLGFIGITLYHCGITFGSQTVTSVTVPSMMYLEPPFTLVIAFIWLGEWLKTHSLVGGASEIDSSMFVHFAEKRKFVKQQIYSKSK